MRQEFDDMLTEMIGYVETKIEMFEPVKSETEIYLPNIESVDAELKDGVLILTAPKVSKGVKIEIK